MNNRIVIIILSSVIVILVAFGIYHERTMRNFYRCAYPGDNRPRNMMMGPEHDMHPGRQFCSPDFMKSKLELSDDQINKITILNETFEKEHDRLFAKVSPERERLRDLLKQDDPDMKQVKSMLEQIARVNVEIQMLRIRQGKVISSILSPAQMERLRNERRRFNREMGPGPGGIE